MKIKKYTDDPNLSLQERYDKLQLHHIEETTELINQIEILEKNLDVVKEEEE